MQTLVERGCGLDVHQATVVACLLIVLKNGQVQKQVRTFGTTTRELMGLREWLLSGGCTHVAMESTGVYWKPIYAILEGAFEIVVANAQHVKKVPGRKTDVKDAEWIADLLCHGLLRASFVPPSPIRELSGICSDEPRHVLGCGAVWPRGLGFLYQRFSSLLGDDACQFRNQQSRTVVKFGDHSSIWNSWPIAFSGYPRGPRVGNETRCPRHTAPEARIALERKAGSWRPTSEYDSVHALREAEAGNSARAQRAAAKALQKVQDRDTQLALALVFARAGDVEQAQKLADALSQGFPLDTVVQNHCLPTIRAAMKLHENDPAAAVEILRPTVKYDLADAESFNSLYPAYIRGLAYLQMGEGRLAAVEFQKLLDHPGRVGREITGALSHLQLARAQKMMRDQAAARKSYEDFLTLWKDADSDIPIYQQAKAEYDKLRKSVDRAF